MNAILMKKEFLHNRVALPENGYHKETEEVRKMMNISFCSPCNNEMPSHKAFSVYAQRLLLSMKKGK